MKIDKIAVCMYGQYRSGLVLSSVISDYFKISDKQVDFFCSVKLYDKFYNTSEQREVELYTYDDDRTEKIITDIKEKYKPKMLNTITAENDLADNLSMNDTHFGLRHGMIDAINLKQLYEIEHNFQYDLVIFFRYDTILWPNNYFNNFIKLLEEDRDLLGQQITDSIYCDYHNMAFVDYTHVTNLKYSPQINDMVFAMTSEATDLLFSQLLVYQSARHDHNTETNTTRNVEALSGTFLGHKLWDSAFRKLSIRAIQLPYIVDEKKGIYCWRPNNNFPNAVKIIISPVRESYYEDKNIDVSEKFEMFKSAQAAQIYFHEHMKTPLKFDL
jgi:hypothetical protein